MKEYGGYLSLELPRNSEYYTAEGGLAVARLHCARSALYCAAQISKPAKVYLPYYNCDAVLEPFKRLGIEVAYYKLDKELLLIYGDNC